MIIYKHNNNIDWKMNYRYKYVLFSFFLIKILTKFNISQTLSNQKLIAADTSNLTTFCTKNTNTNSQQFWSYNYTTLKYVLKPSTSINDTCVKLSQTGKILESLKYYYSFNLSNFSYSIIDSIPFGFNIVAINDNPTLACGFNADNVFQTYTLNVTANRFILAYNFTRQNYIYTSDTRCTTILQNSYLTGQTLYYVWNSELSTYLKGSQFWQNTSISMIGDTLTSQKPRQIVFWNISNLTSAVTTFNLNDANGCYPSSVIAVSKNMNVVAVYCSNSSKISLWEFNNGTYTRFTDMQYYGIVYKIFITYDSLKVVISNSTQIDVYVWSQNAINNTNATNSTSNQTSTNSTNSTTSSNSTSNGTNNSTIPSTIHVPNNHQINTIQLKVEYTYILVILTVFFILTLIAIRVLIYFYTKLERGEAQLHVENSMESIRKESI